VVAIVKNRDFLSQDHMVFTMGLPGSGKTTRAKQLYGSYVFIDPDIFQESHPDYDPKNPAPIHEWSPIHLWSVEKAEEAFQKALLEKGDYVIDGTGINADRMCRRATEAKAAGFMTTLLYMKVSLETALARNKARERQVPEYIIRDNARDVETSFNIRTEFVDEILVQ